MTQMICTHSIWAICKIYINKFFLLQICGTKNTLSNIKGMLAGIMQRFVQIFFYFNLQALVETEKLYLFYIIKTEKYFI